MSIERLEILVEEASMEAGLRLMLPNWLGAVDFEIFPFQGKFDLFAKLPDRLRGYSRFLPVNWRILVLIDRDQTDCRELKQQLEDIAAQAGLVTRSSAGGADYQLVNCVFVEELEAWYFGDWDAVRKAYPKIDGKWPGKAAYRDPDKITGGTWESFERIAQKAGYFKNGLPKVLAATEIALSSSRRLIDRLASNAFGE